MKVLFDRLSRICTDNPLKEKIIVMPSLSAGNALLRSFSLAGYGYINLHIHTVSGMAAEKMATRLHREGLQLLPGVLAARIIQEVMHELLEDGALAYFHTLQVNPGIASAIWASVQELKEIGYHPEGIPADKFIHPSKGEDIRRIFAAYQERLAKKGLIDRAGLLQMALKAYAESFFPGVMLLLPVNLQVTPLERELLAKMLKDHPWASLPLEEVRGLKTPGNYFFEHAPVDRLADRAGFSLGDTYNRNLPSLKKEVLPTVTFSHSHGETAEVREVLRQIRREKIRLEEVVVYYTSREPYAQVFFEEARRFGLPVTFGEGIDAGNFRPGKLFFALTEWIKTDFDVTVLYRLLRSSAFKVDPDLEPPKNSMARELRSSNIVRGRERYQKWISEQPAAETSPEKTGGLKNLLAELLDSIPVPDDSALISPGELAAGLAAILEKRSARAGEADARAYRTIQENLNLVSGSPLEKTTMGEAVKWVEGLVSSLRVGCSLPEAGSLHIDGYKNGLWTSRHRVFITGLAARKFPGQATEDPILLDMEREELGGSLYKYRFQPVENLFEMVQLLAARGAGSSKLTLSFPAYHTVENREEAPSPLLLQVYRLVSGETAADYSRLLQKLGPRKGFIPRESSESLSEAEWWLERLAGQKAARGLQEPVLELYPGLKQGLHSRQQRSSPSFTAHDGGIFPGKPLWEDGGLFSASGLEQLGKCPYGYFLNYVLRIAPPSEMAYDPEKWLDALTRGDLLHRIFEDFYRRLLEQKEKPSYSRHLKLLESIARQKMEQQREEQPPPYEAIYAYEYREIMESCRLFLRAEEENAAYSTPVYLELTFGLEGVENQEIRGEIPPVKVNLPSGRHFLLRGKIDRVDRLHADGAYTVLDYKTGSTYAFRPGSMFWGGRQLQHALYGLALEDICRRKGICDEPRVQDCGYLFPTIKGEGQRVMRSFKECREEVLGILDSLCDLLSNGAFVMTIEPDVDCTFCDYAVICEMDTFGKAVEEKVKKSDIGALAKYYALRQIK
ncbi:MAG: PD-(D/E)XK nuclease family protein [Dethiobacteria bacterium]